MTTLTPGRDVPPMYRRIAEAAPRSRANAVKLFCLECVGYVRKDVTNCTAPLCPLFAWRPYRDGREEEAFPPEISGFGDLGDAQPTPTGQDATATLRDDFALTDEVSR